MSSPAKRSRPKSKDSASRYSTSRLTLVGREEVVAHLQARRKALGDIRPIPREPAPNSAYQERPPNGNQLDVKCVDDKLQVCWAYGSEAFHRSKDYAKQHGKWDGSNWVLPAKNLNAFKAHCAEKGLTIRDHAALRAAHDAKQAKSAQERDVFETVRSRAQTLATVQSAGRAGTIVSSDLTTQDRVDLQALQILYAALIDAKPSTYVAAITDAWRPIWLPFRTLISPSPKGPAPTSPPLTAQLHPDRLRANVTFDFSDGRHIATMVEIRRRLQLDTKVLDLTDAQAVVAIDLLQRVAGDNDLTVTVEAPPPIVLTDDLCARIPGWRYPTQAHEKRLMEHQRSLVEYLVARNGCGLVGDEMGTGKTAGAVASAMALDTKRIVTIHPVSVLSQWSREIAEFSDAAHTMIPLSLAEHDAFPPGDGWIGVTYDSIIDKARVIKCGSAEEADLVRRYVDGEHDPLTVRLTMTPILRERLTLFADDAEFENLSRKVSGAVEKAIATLDCYRRARAMAPKRVTIKCGDEEEARLLRHWADYGTSAKAKPARTKISDDDDISVSTNDKLRVKIPATRDVRDRLKTLIESDDFATLTLKTAKAVVKTAKNLINPLRQKLLDWAPQMMIIDEAHRVKNPAAARTKAVLELSQAASHRVALSGTFLRNVPEDLNAIADIVAPGLRVDLADFFPKADRVQIARKIVETVMIRRAKADVLKDLPPMSRNTLGLPFTDLEVSKEYRKKMDDADEAYYQAFVASSGDARAARDAATGHWSTARNILGQIKVKHPETMEILNDALEENGSLIVFAHHEAARNHIAEQLKRRNVKVAQISGKTAPSARAQMIDQFQDGALDALVISTLAAGEGITLTRAPAVHFLELDWVPSNLLQAEARIHRQGQTAHTTAYHVLADFAPELVPEHLNLDLIMADKIIAKQAVINEVLQENQEVMGAPAASRRNGRTTPRDEDDMDVADDPNASALAALADATHQRTLARIEAEKPR
jgi:hypothetical protein